MAAPAAAPPLGVPQALRHRLTAALAALRPTWSVPALMRAIRATIVVPALFALASKVIGNPQVATFAAFGGFATLLLASFNGTRRDKLVAHAGLAVTGSVLLAIGTTVSGTTWIAALVTVPVVFAVLFGGIVGPNAASGATAALLVYVLPAASPGTAAMIPDRLAGWWMASVAGTVAVLVLSPRPGADRLRSASARLASALAAAIDAGTAGLPLGDRVEEAGAARDGLLASFTAAPYRATGIADADQALANLVETLHWCTGLVFDTFAEGSGVAAADDLDGRLLAESAAVLRQTATMLSGGRGVVAPIADLDELRSESAARLCARRDARQMTAEEAHAAFHAGGVAVAARTAALDAVIASGRGDAATIARARQRWEGAPGDAPPPPRNVLLEVPRRVVLGNASLRSVWFLNSARGAIAIAAAVAIADVSNVQHGFWVVLGALSVLRTNAQATRATALRAITGTAVGLVIGAAVIIGIGVHTDALWVALPLAIFVAAYTPGTAPFAFGQAAFTVTLSVFYNLIIPVGWKVGVVRVEDVAIGAAVSVLASILFWPRGAGRVVTDDLADALHLDGLYLVQATAWAVGMRDREPDAGTAAARAGTRLDDALRILLTEQGTKNVAKEQLWRLVGACVRLRLAAQSLATLPRPPATPNPSARELLDEAVHLAGQCDDLAMRFGHLPDTVARELATLPALEIPTETHAGYSLWVREHLSHVRRDLAEVSVPAAAVIERTRAPWWR